MQHPREVTVQWRPARAGGALVLVLIDSLALLLRPAPCRQRRLSAEKAAGQGVAAAGGREPGCVHSSVEDQGGVVKVPTAAARASQTEGRGVQGPSDESSLGVTSQQREGYAGRMIEAVWWELKPEGAPRPDRGGAGEEERERAL